MDLFRIEQIGRGRSAIVSTETGDTRWQGPTESADAECARMTAATIELRAAELVVAPLRGGDAALDTECGSGLYAPGPEAS